MPLIPDLNSPGGNFAPSTPSVSVAALAGVGMGALAKGLGTVTDDIGGTMERLSKARDIGVGNVAKLSMQQAFAEHQEYRMQNPDESTWEADMQTRVQAAQARVMKESMSPFMKTRLESEFQGWAGNAISTTRLDGMKQTQARSRQRTTNAYEAYVAANDFDSAESTLREASGTVFLPEEVEADLIALRKHRADYAEKKAFDDAQARIAEDPGAWLAENPLGAIPEGENPMMWQRKRSLARQLHGQEQQEIVQAIRDGMASGDVLKPEQIDDMADRASPATREILKNELAEIHDVEIQRARLTPEYQSKVVGSVSERLADLDPEDSDQVIQIDSLIRQLPPGALKSHYSAALKSKIDGEPIEDDALSLNLRMADDAFKAGWFGKTRRAQSVTASIADGFLTDTRPAGSLQSLGLSQDEAKQVAAATTDTERRAKFRELWKPDKVPSGVDALRVETARAIRDGSGGEVSVEDPAAKWAELEAYGRVKAETIKWAKANTNASADDIRRKMLELAAPGKRAEFLDSVFGSLQTTPAPDPTALPLPSGFGPSPMILPPLEK